MIPSPPPPCCRKKTRKRRNKSAAKESRFFDGPHGSRPFSRAACVTLFAMKITRRIVAFSLLLAPLVFSLARGSAGKRALNRKYLAFVGTYTTKTESKGIYAYEFDAPAGKLTPRGLAAETPDPSW